MKHFSGSPERVINYFKFIAQDVREILASIGAKSIDELIGQTQYLSISKGITQKQKSLKKVPLKIVTYTHNIKR